MSNSGQVVNVSGKGDEKVKKQRRKRKEKKAVIELSLWVNGVKYEFGLLCTFCAKVPAVCHCPLCTDFYCQGCDAVAHKTKKRQDHVRTTLSKLNMHTAAHLITRAVRRYSIIKKLQKRCRIIFKRHFDRKTLNYYYLNTLYGTTSWRKPYILRQEELFPFMTPEYAACKCQNLYYLWRAREKTRNALAAQYTKVFDRRSGRFYYGFHGKSKLLPRSSWQKPRFLGKRSFPKDILPVYTQDVAAIIIQRKWRTILIRSFFQALARVTYEEIWDPVLGKFNYLNRNNDIIYPNKPLVLRNEPWDPNRVPEWSMERVSIFLRRIGLKQYVNKFLNYEVDGNVLLLLDDEDYENLEITNRIHIKKIAVELEKIFRPTKHVVINAEMHEQRRETIRRRKMFFVSAIMIQKHFRRFRAQRELEMLRNLQRLEAQEAIIKKHIKDTGIWWTEHAKLPSKKLDPGVVDKKTGVRFPPIKTFGRRKDFLSCEGWGHKAGSLTSSWLPTLAATVDPNFMGDTHITQQYTEKLHVNRYDDKRKDAFFKKLLYS